MKTVSLLLCLFCAVSTKAQPLPMRLHYDKPAAFFEESLPIGNGKIGALVYGGADVNTIHLNDITLWTGTPVDQEEDKGASRWISEIRKSFKRNTEKEGRHEMAK